MPRPFGASLATQIPARLLKCLNESAVRYEILHEPSDPAAPRRRSAAIGLIETAVVRAGNRRLLAVLPASHRVNLKRFARLIGEVVRSETEDEFKWLFPDCALGAIPPFGNLYGLTTWVDSSLAGTQHIVFFAGNLNDSIKLAYSAFAEIVKPSIGAFIGSVPGNR